MSIAVALLFSLNAAAADPALAAEARPEAAAVQPGQWQQHDVTFTYSGFTSKYSCDGLADKVKLLLRAVGARADARVTSYGCSEPFGRPTEFPRVRLQFATLAPAAPAAGATAPRTDLRAGAPGATKPAAPPNAYGHVIGREAPRIGAPAAAVAPPAGEAVPGRWQRVKLSRNSPRSLDPGDCELVEQFRDKVLPLFATRDIDDDTRCVPHQVAGTSVDLEVEVFTAPAAGADARR
jgi:hypothetical protein